MKSQSMEIIKDLITSILVVLCIALVLSVVFYDKISLSKVVPEGEEYFLPEQMKKELEDTVLDDAQKVIVNYHIDASDLKKYEKNNEYLQGKSHPFAEIIINDTENSIDNSTSEENTSTDNNSSTGNFWEDDGTK